MEGPSPLPNKNSRYHALPARDIVDDDDDDHEHHHAQNSTPRASRNNTPYSSPSRPAGVGSNSNSSNGNTIEGGTVASLSSTKMIPLSDNGHNRYCTVVASNAANGGGSKSSSKQHARSPSRSASNGDDRMALNQDDDDEDGTEINSLVDDIRSPASSIFRTPSWHRSSEDQPMEISISTDPIKNSQHHHHHVMGGVASNNFTAGIHSATTSPLHSSVLSRNASRDSASLGPHWDDDIDDNHEHDHDDEYDDDDEINLRRYQLDFTAARDVPLPAEFRGHTWNDRIHFTVKQYATLALRNWQGLRQAARQRRAARLLTMPSETLRYRFRACFLSWCCDATDMGIACTAACLAVWIVVGLVVSSVASRRYWMTGVLLFVVRITARRSYEACLAFWAGRRRQRQQQRQQRQQQQQQRGRLGSRQRLASTASSSVDDDSPHHHSMATSAKMPNVITGPMDAAAADAASRKATQQQQQLHNAAASLPPPV